MVMQIDPSSKSYFTRMGIFYSLGTTGENVVMTSQIKRVTDNRNNQTYSYSYMTGVGMHHIALETTTAPKAATFKTTTTTSPIKFD